LGWLAVIAADSASVRHDDSPPEWGRSGTWLIILVSILTVLVLFLFHWLGPPTVEEVEADIWKDWARATVDSQGENIAGLLAQRRQEACQKLLDDFGQTTTKYGESFVLRTSVRSIRVIDAAGNTFASWESEEASLAGPPVGWSNVTIPLFLEEQEPLGKLEVLYKFNELTLGALPNLRRIAWLHDLAGWLFAFLGMAMILAVLANLHRLRERALRVRSQQVTLDLARQLCHELRNGLWAFSLEGNNLRRLFEMIENYFSQEPQALAEAAQRLRIDPKEMDRLRRQIKKQLADLHLDPQTDVLSATELAKDAHQQIESFSKYINLTVEQLDRNLLGQNLQWEPISVRTSECWKQAHELLTLRIQSAGVKLEEVIETSDDWVHLDRRALVHVFVNLAKNALEAMRDQRPAGKITFRLRQSGDHVEAIVHNTGRPIDPAILPHIFRDGFSTKLGAGRGIGLALVKESVRRMAGTIWVESDATGTSFHLKLPHKRPSESPPLQVGSK
jgi:signal transduction histidine kinase